MDPLVPKNVSTRREDHQEDNHDAEEDEGDGAEGDLLQVAAGQRAGHRRQLPQLDATSRGVQPPLARQAAPPQRMLGMSRVQGHRVSQLKD